jgi:hypothetical protein
VQHRKNKGGHMVSRKLVFSFIALLGSGLLGCAPVDHGRMGVWGRPEVLWASCECVRPRDENAKPVRNVNFDTGGGRNCGGADEKARNTFCGQKCDSAGYQEGAYRMCLH